jgi:hypothetical protein
LQACCTSGAAFPEGCSSAIPSCWLAGAAAFPARACAPAADAASCRGGESFATEADCCTPGAAFSDGCGGAPAGAETGAEQPLWEEPLEEPAF